jgi:Tfp pilus assembly PilM family ATPase/Tfp pilus assembly protein PilN
MLVKSTNFLAISFTEEKLRICHIKGRGPGAKVVNAVAKDIKGISDINLPKAIQDALKGINTKGAEAVCIVPPSMTTTKNIEIPSTNEEEIKSIVSLQASRHTPFSREEIQVSYVNLGVHKGNYTKILLIIANKNVIKNQLDILAKAGLKVNHVVFSPEGIAALYGTGAGLKAEASPVAVIDVTDEYTDFVVTLRGLSLVSRNIPIGKQHLRDPESVAKLVDELSKTVEAYQSDEIEAVPAKYIIANEDAADLKNALTERLGWQVELRTPAEFMKPSSSILKKLNKSFPEVSFLGVFAPVVMMKDIKVDLMPEEILLQRSVEEQGKEVFKAAVLGFVILVLIALTVGLRMYFHHTALTNLQKKYKANREEVSMLENISRRADMLNSYMAGRTASLDVIMELYRKIPRDVYLSSIIMEADGTVNIQGVSDIASVVFNLGTTLKESDMFESVEIKSTTAKKDRGKDVSAFEISLKVKQVEDNKN